MTENAIVQQQYLTFFLAGEEYAVPVLRVKEILEYEVVTRVPKTPSWVRGVFNLRGSVVPVVDLATKFGMGETKISKTTCVVIVEIGLAAETVVMGVIVDSVSQVIDISDKDIEPAPSFGTLVHLSYLAGMVTMGKKFALLLNIDEVLSTDEIVQVQLKDESVEGLAPRNSTLDTSAKTSFGREGSSQAQA
jgi:purine-binding chemotaxis protein CheW